MESEYGAASHGGDECEGKQEAMEEVEQHLEERGNVFVTPDEGGSLQQDRRPECGSGVVEVTVMGKSRGAYDGVSDVGNNGGDEDVSVNKDDGSGVDKVYDGNDEEERRKNDQVELGQLSRQSQIAEGGHVHPMVSGDAVEVMSSHIQTEPHDTADHLKPVEYPHEDSNGRAIESSQLDTNDADDTVGKYDRKADQTQVISSITVWVKQAETAGLDNRMEDIPIADQTGHGPGQFPALDNVDLESDEEGEKDSGRKGHAEHHDGSCGSNGDMLEERVTQEGEVTDKSVREEGAITSGSSRDRQVLTSAADYVYGGGGGDTTSPLNNHQDLHKEYPLNYQNYKVCRELSPGVKQCLILETGEEYICVTQQKSVPDGSLGAPTEDVEMDQPVFQTRSKSCHPHGSPGIDDADNAQTATTAHLSGDTDVFSYISLHESGRGMPGAGFSCGLANGQQQQMRNNGATTVLGNGEDVEKLGLHAENGMLETFVVHVEDTMVEPEMGYAKDVMVPSGEGDVFFNDHGEDLLGREIVEDVLDSEAEISQQSSYERGPSLKKSNRTKPSRFIEIQPEIIASVTEESAATSESEVNVNNNSNDRDPEGATNTNENANSRQKMERQQHRGDSSIRSSHYPSDRSYRTERGDQSNSYDRYITGSRGVSTAESRTYSQSASRESSYLDSRGLRSGEGSSYYRSRDPNSADSSQISTRYTRVDLGDSKNWASRPTSVTIPKFKTLHDQQVNWLEMFKMIEQQHRTELQSQYQEHQKILQDMQKNMEKELMKQQNTLKQRLLTHREMLEELSPSRPAGKNVNQSWTRNEGDNVSLDSLRSSDNTLTNNTSHTTLQGVPVTLRNPPPMSRYHHDTREHKMPDELPVKRSLDKEFSSPVRPADTSLNLSSHVSIDRDKQLRGGVYSSPFPLAKVKHKKSPRGSKSCENTHHGSPREEASHNTNSVHWAHDRRSGNEQCHGSTDVSITESNEVLSPRTRIALKEKHAKHLADLQAYYEKELLALREVRGSGGQGVTATDKILASENQELRQNCQELQEAFHDAKIEIRELQQKIQGLEIRAADYSDRYSVAQSQVLTLKSRLEEVTDYAREKEAVAADLASKDRKNAESLQMAYKKENELTESLHNAKNTIQKLVDKYETLEKDHAIVKETAAETQEKLYGSRTEMVETNSKLSRLEMENKQLKHDVENLRHNLSMAQGAVTMHTSYEDAYPKAGNSNRARSTYTSIHTSRTRSTDRTRSSDRSYNSHSRERQNVRNDSSPESESDNDYMRSPIIKAERELKKLQQSQEFTPKLQRKFYGTERPASYSGPPITVDHSAHSPCSTKSHSPMDKRTHLSSQSNSRSSAPISSYFSRSQRAGSRLSKENEKSSSYLSYKGNDSNRNYNMSPKKSTNVTNGLTSDQAIERVKSGEIVSRPGWEDVYTSLTSGQPGVTGSKSSSMNYTRDQIFRERIQNIENLEKKYDDLTIEKRKHEAALSKVPGQGHGRERDRLETELDRVDRELGSVRMSLKRYHVLKSTI